MRLGCELPEVPDGRACESMKKVPDAAHHTQRRGHSRFQRFYLPESMPCSREPLFDFSESRGFFLNRVKPHETMNAVHESDNHETANWFLETGKKFTLFTTLELEGRFSSRFTAF